MTRTRAFFGAVVAVATTAVVALTGLVAVPAEATVTTASARPANGKILFSKARSGSGILTIKNGNGRDAVVTLVRGKGKVVSLYVRAKRTASIKSIDDGTYRLYFMSGYRYSVTKHRFGKSPSYRIFDNKLRFTTNSTTYTHYTLTLYAVKGGNARVSPVDPKNFPT
ncbi:hypothetical protein J5X84_36530 [Streptosporangiaceae bacterium NEAU-GS5]|nr:hypothetical protein [Streptosporangiaceae bacterium NEAU-GS5]